jgi:prepilin-type N-terminal cleavage/methylation domain-containing protein
MKKIYNKGFTLIELLISIGIFSLIIVALGMFQRNVFQFNKFGADSLVTIQDGRTILRNMVREMRPMSPANTGSYPISSISTSSVTFFSDTNSDNLKEQIRYFIEETNLKRGTITPSGSPLSYDPTSESISILAYNVKNSTTTPLFEYFDANYTGTSSPLTLPTTLTNVHLIKINLMLDVDPNRSPIPRTYTSQVSLRNLKDNL